MSFFSPRRVALLFSIAVVCVYAQGHATSVASMSLPEIEEQLQQCPLVQDLNAYKQVTSPITSTLTSRIFAVLFPSTPAVNALLATLYISGPPNFLLALCPPNIDPASLSVMVAFAVGGLLGDTLFHLLPEIFLGEDSHENVRFVLVEPNRNLLLGVAIMVGFVTFVAMDKGLRIATGGQGHEHSHSHGHDSEKETSAISSNLDDTPARSTRSRKKDNGNADFTHNITDGLAMSSSFYASPTIGATTTVAVFFHEIPHEVGDFALLIQSGFSKRAAMGAQFVTALGALLGTVIGIVIQEYGSSTEEGGIGRFDGLMGTSLEWGDMLLPFTAGTFLYVGTVAVIPELLETGKDRGVELTKTLKQFMAMAAGAGIMLYISWS
ncbi:Histidine-rich membrane protein KE4-like protein 1 [Botrytis cinerea]